MKLTLFFKVLYRSVFGFLIIISISCKENQEIKTTSNSKVLPEIKTSLADLVRVWYPISIDSINGGFYPDFNYKWEKEGEQNKMLVTQARHIWT
ncbi:MAG: N-acylglucosamine 2-epimerase, partial [Eudoraea sp.]